jgi:hypothetical protein
MGAKKRGAKIVNKTTLSTLAEKIDTAISDDQSMAVMYSVERLSPRYRTVLVRSGPGVGQVS